MQKIPLRLLAVCLIFQSCVRQVVPLKGEYPKTTLKTTVNNNFEKAWEGVIDFLTDSGHEVQLIDKQSGIIISDVKFAAGKYISHEDKEGRIVNKDAFIAVERFKDEYPRGVLPNHYATSKWTIRVKEAGRDNTSIGVLMHVKSVDLGYPTIVSSYRGQSTGNYEKQMLEEIKSKLSR